MATKTDSAPGGSAEIPAELVWQGSFDAFSAELDDPFEAVCRLHDGPEIIWATDASYGRPGWIVTRSERIVEVFGDHERFTAERTGMIADLLGVNLRLNPIEIDPPRHHGFRRNLNPLFTPKAVAAREDAVRATCRELIQRLSGRTSCDFVADFAVPFPTYVFLDLMAMPRELATDFLRWEEGLMRGPDMETRVASARAIYAYLERHAAEQAQKPGNDLMRAIVTARFEDRPLDHLEMMGMLFVLYVGGLDTVYSTLGWTMRHLAGDPAMQERLRRDPAAIPAAVEEFCRAFSVVVTHREVAKDCTLGGVRMRKGQEVNLPLALANRDPAVFADPHRIDIDRKPRHVAFGSGAHSCLGVHLAKREIRIVLEEFLGSFREIRLQPGENYKFHTGRTFGIDYLPVTWRA